MVVGSIDGLMTSYSVTRVGTGYRASAVWIDRDATTSAELFDRTPIDFFLSNEEMTCLASAANPYPGDTSFAVATSNGALIAFANQANWTIDYSTKSSNTSNVRAVDWKDTDVVIEGCEDGLVRLWDLRNRGEVTRFQHPSVVNYAKGIVDENRIIVAGHESQVLNSIAADSQIC